MGAIGGVGDLENVVRTADDGNGERGRLDQVRQEAVLVGQLGVQPGVIDRRRRTVGDGFHEIKVVVAQRPRGGPEHQDAAQDLPSAAHRHQQRLPHTHRPHDYGEIVRQRQRIDVRDLHRLPAQEQPPDESRCDAGRGYT